MQDIKTYPFNCGGWRGNNVQDIKTYSTNCGADGKERIFMMENNAHQALSICLACIFCWMF